MEFYVTIVALHVQFSYLLVSAALFGAFYVRQMLFW